MAENDYSDAVIGVSFDGTGYGTDGTIWGGEILTADYHDFCREYSIAPFTQIGGDSAPRQGWRIAASMIWNYCRSARPLYSIMEELAVCDQQNAKVQRLMAERRMQAVTSTSAGRLFDGVSAMLGICRESTYEGEASIELEFAAERYAAKLAKEAPCPTENWMIFGRLFVLTGKPAIFPRTACLNSFWRDALQAKTPKSWPGFSTYFSRNLLSGPVPGSGSKKASTRLPLQAAVTRTAFS